MFSLAAQFITGFAKGDPALPFTAFPALKVEETGDSSCDEVIFAGAYSNAVAKGLVKNADVPVYAVFYSGLDTYYVEAYVAENGKDVSLLSHIIV